MTSLCCAILRTNCSSHALIDVACPVVQCVVVYAAAVAYLSTAATLYKLFHVIPVVA